MARNCVINMITNYEDSYDQLEIYTVVAMEEKRPERQSISHRGVKDRKYIRRDFGQGHERLFLDYFAEPPVYPSNLFQRRFRMRRCLFLQIQAVAEASDPYFIQKRNAAGMLGLSSLQKMIVALWMLAYRITVDYMDEYLRIGESTALDSLKKFVKAIVVIYSNKYLRSPNNDDIAKLLAVGESRDFPGMLGSIDCMHYKWKNYPTALSGMLPGSHNDINMLDRSPVFAELAEDHGPPINYSINGNDYTMGYYLANGIYPQWSTFIKTIPCPRGNKKKYFASAQESTRKDIERAFEVLQARFAIVPQPAHFLNTKTLKYVMMACVILHNMIVEDERYVNGLEDFNYDAIDRSSQEPVSHKHTPEFMEFIQN
ncbi:uncharacterized protein LOC114257789 [Camellia sinensis]|uniref:uncharacterized protein LOC114257789 n=1 Tax=Camellia sinensis TaxID=4442 RepID=UPI001036DF5C|nr:uncharacterized protein LOC114257789 [Camellia sinensis]